jgi:broad specificity phosphatase PhoE
VSGDNGGVSTEVLVIRHAQTFGNVEGLFCGHSETALTPLGIAQAQALGRRLASFTIDAAISSDLSRAADTARHALASHRLEPSFDPRLREMHYGDWEALPGKELIAQQPETMQAFFRCEIAAPGGESVADVRARTHSAFRAAVDAHQGKTIALVSHGNAIMALLAELLGMPASSTWAFALENASLTRIHVAATGRVTIRTMNDHSHIEGVEA